MNRHGINFQIVIRVVPVVLLSVAIGWLIASGQSLVWVIMCLIPIIILIVDTIKHVGATNRKIAYFLESVENEDSALMFPADRVSGSVRDVYVGLNKVNRQIQQLKIESRQQEQYFQALIEHAATGIVTYNAKGFVLHSNTAAKKMFGIDVLTHISQLERVNKNLFQSVKNIAPFEQKLVSMSTERNTVQLSLKAAPFKAKDGQLVLLSVQDIKHELDEKELDSWMKLIRVLMHEIMNSIAPITSLSESLCRFFTVDGRLVLPEEITEGTIRSTARGLDVIKEQGNGLIAFVESYRKLTRLPKPDKKLVRIDELFVRMKVLYPSLTHSDNVSFSAIIDPPDLEIFIDTNLIAQALINIVNNAIQANEGRPNAKIQIVANVGIDRRPQICVADNGPGMTAEVLEQIFVPFFTTRENGSGIGLSLSRQIMRLHGGSLQVRSIPDKETVFRMVF